MQFNLDICNLSKHIDLRVGPLLSVGFLRGHAACKSKRWNSIVKLSHDINNISNTSGAAKLQNQGAISWTITSARSRRQPTGTIYKMAAPY